MTPEEFIQNLKTYLDTKSQGDRISNWTFREKTLKYYSSINGSWDREMYQGYLFQNGDSSFILRPVIISSKPYLVVDNESTKKDTVNYLMDKKRYFVKGDTLTLKDAYVLNTGGLRRENELSDLQLYLAHLL